MLLTCNLVFFGNSISVSILRKMITNESEIPATPYLLIKFPIKKYAQYTVKLFVIVQFVRMSDAPGSRRNLTGSDGN